MSVSSISSGASNPYLNGVNRHQQFLQKLQSDGSQQAQTVKTDFAKIAADLQSGDANALKSDSQSLHQAMQAYRQANGGGHVHHAHGRHHDHDGDRDDLSAAGGASQTASTQNPLATASNDGTSDASTSQDPLMALLTQLQSQASSQQSMFYGQNALSLPQLFSTQA